MENNLRTKLIDEARKNGSKFGKKAELDFGAGAEWMYNELKKQLTLTDVGCSLKVLCKDLNLDPESVLLEYCNTENGFEVFYDEGIEQTYLVKKGFIQL
tara:strand:+ start:344 stop:640 length:297 start_codon:yes stop_codon:yes gene_type:complete